MAEVADILEVETPQSKKVPVAAKQGLPIEQRTDVTVEELEKTSLPYPAELYNGKVVFKMATYAHGKIQLRIGGKLDYYLEQNPVGEAMTETNFQLWPERRNQSRIPDIAFVKKERVPREQWRFADLAPDLAVEIISPEDNFLKIMNKVDAYLEQGTQIVWVVISDTREVLVCTATSKHSVKDVLTAPELLPGFELPVSKIFEGLPLPDKSLAE
jgi:Uma2 family endonuclease